MTPMTTDNPSFEVIMLATREIEAYAQLAKDSWRGYCDRHGHRFTIIEDALVPDMHINWSKIEAMRRALTTGDTAYVLLVDADVVVVRPEIYLSAFTDQTKDIVFASDSAIPSPLPDLRHVGIKLRLRWPVLPNAGFMLARRNDAAAFFFARWLELAKGELSDWADRHPRNQNVLWRGLLVEHGHYVGVLGNQILRITHPRHVRRVAARKPFAIHFRHEKVDVNEILPLVPSGN
jgi:hypothetical protein